MNMDLEEKCAAAIKAAKRQGEMITYEEVVQAVLSCLEENGMGELAKLERLVRIADEALRQAPFECGEKWRKEYTDYLTNKAMAELAAAPKQG
jgi:hypothetical protein